MSERRLVTVYIRFTRLMLQSCTKVVHLNVCITNKIKRDLQSVQKTASDSLCLFQFEVFRKQQLRFYSSQQCVCVFSRLLPPGGHMRLLQQHHPHQVSNITHTHTHTSFMGGVSFNNVCFLINATVLHFYPISVKM